MKRRLWLLVGGLVAAAGALAAVAVKERRREPVPVAPPEAPPVPVRPLEGRVVLPSGEVAPGAIVRIKRRSETTFSGVRIDGASRFVDVYFCRAGCVLAAGAPPDLVAGPVVVTDASSPIRLVLQQAKAVLRGKVTDGAAPVDRAGVTLEDGNDNVFVAQTDGTGAYSLGFIPGILTVRPGALDHLNIHQRRDLTTLRSLDVVLAPAGTVTVKSKGTGVAAWPPVEEDVDIGTGRTETDDLVIGYLPLGQRTVWAFDAVSVGHADVTVVAGDTGPVSIDLSPGATVSGRVVGADGAPLDAAAVSVKGPVPRQVRTSGDGFYRLEGLAPVRTVVWVQKSGFVTTHRETDAVAGEVSTLALPMDPAAAP